MSEILEKNVANQLTAVLTEHHIVDKFQSGFRKQHSTETALLRASNDLLMAADNSKCSILVLLDLSVAFDTVDYSILINRLREWVGVTGSALDWFKSYLENRCFSVALGPHVSWLSRFHVSICTVHTSTRTDYKLFKSNFVSLLRR